MKHVRLFLRLALAFPFLYASISSLLSPNDWLWYIPDWVGKIFPATNLLLLGHGLFELALGLWILSGKKTYYAAIIAVVDLTSNTLLNVSAMNTVFRDVGLIFAAIALAVLERNQKLPDNQ